MSNVYLKSLTIVLKWKTCIYIDKKCVSVSDVEKQSTTVFLPPCYWNIFVYVVSNLCYKDKALKHEVLLDKCQKSVSKYPQLHY